MTPYAHTYALLMSVIDELETDAALKYRQGLKQRHKKATTRFTWEHDTDKTEDMERQIMEREYFEQLNEIV